MINTLLGLVLLGCATVAGWRVGVAQGRADERERWIRWVRAMSLRDRMPR